MANADNPMTRPAVPEPPTRVRWLAGAILAVAAGLVSAGCSGTPATPVTSTVTVTSVVTTTVTATPTAPASAAPSTTAPPAPVFMENFIAVNPTAVKQGAIVVEIHTDYQCPYCKDAEDIYGGALGELSQSGDIDLRIVLRTMVGDRIIKNDSSERAANAAVCASEAGHFWAYHSAVFTNQPAEGVGFTDDQLRNAFAAQAGITGADLTAFQTCYDTKAMADRVTAMESEAWQAGVNGTPAFFVNGVKYSWNLQMAAPTAAELLNGLQQIAAGG